MEGLVWQGRVAFGAFLIRASFILTEIWCDVWHGYVVRLWAIKLSKFKLKGVSSVISNFFSDFPETNIFYVSKSLKRIKLKVKF